MEITSPLSRFLTKVGLLAGWVVARQRFDGDKQFAESQPMRQSKPVIAALGTQFFTLAHPVIDKHEAPASEFVAFNGIHSLALRAGI